MSKIFGIGWAKTGTTTLGQCFRILGYNHQSQNLGLVQDIQKGDLSKIMALAQRKETFEDWPWIILYKELEKAFPDSRFILTIRDPEKWIRSYTNMLTAKGTASESTNRIRQILYGLPFPDVTEAQMVERYQRHNQEVRLHFRDRPRDLLIVDWERGHGWKELCEFLEREIPGDPFPHMNRGEYSANPTMKSSLTNVLRRLINQAPA